MKPLLPMLMILRRPSPSLTALLTGLLVAAQFAHPLPARAQTAEVMAADAVKNATAAKNDASDARQQIEELRTELGRAVTEANEAKRTAIEAAGVANATAIRAASAPITAGTGRGTAGTHASGGAGKAPASIDPLRENPELLTPAPIRAQAPAPQPPAVAAPQTPPPAIVAVPLASTPIDASAGAGGSVAPAPVSIPIAVTNPAGGAASVVSAPAGAATVLATPGGATTVVAAPAPGTPSPSAPKPIKLSEVRNGDPDESYSLSVYELPDHRILFERCKISSDPGARPTECSPIGGRTYSRRELERGGNSIRTESYRKIRNDTLTLGSGIALGALVLPRLGGSVGGVGGKAATVLALGYAVPSVSNLWQEFTDHGKLKEKLGETIQNHAFVPGAPASAGCVTQVETNDSIYRFSNSLADLLRKLN